MRVSLSCLVLLFGCSGELATDAPRDLPLQSRGSLATALDGEPVALAYDGQPAQVALQHRQDTAGQGCVLQATLVASRPDGSCRLELVYRPWIGSGGLHLDEARLTVRAQDAVVPRCAAWPDEPLAVPGDAIEYDLHAGTSTLSVPAVNVKAGLTALVRGALLQPAGVVTLKYQGRKVDLDLGQLAFVGDVTSQGVPAVQCSPCQGPQCLSPYPKFQLRDIQPKSKNFGLTYGLEVFAHRPLVVLLVAGWCNPCVYDAPRFQAMRNQLVAAGHDVAFVAVNMSNASAPDLQKQITSRLTEPVLQDTPEVNAFGVLGGEKTDVYLYHSDGTLAQHLPQVVGIERDDSPAYIKVKDAILALH